MAEIGKEHRVFNVKYPPQRAGGGDAFPPAAGDGRADDAENIQKAIDRLSFFRDGDPRFLLTENTKLGGTVYFPPGYYLIGRGTVVPTAGTGPDRPTPVPENPVLKPALFVPRDVTLEFAPGAMLLLEGPSGKGTGARVEIVGGISAGLYQIFGSDPRPLAMRTGFDPRFPFPIWTPQTMSLLDGTTIWDREVPGAVVITGTALDAIYPEWWGAVDHWLGGRVDDNSLPIQAALDAAHKDRMLQLPKGPQVRPSIPVRLTYQYLTRKPLIVEGNPGTPGTPSLVQGFRLEGARMPANDAAVSPTLLAEFNDVTAALAYARQYNIPLAALFMKRTFGGIVENVQFSVGDGVRTGLWIEAGPRDTAMPKTNLLGAGSTSGSTQMMNVKNCGFTSTLTNTDLCELVFLGGGNGDPPMGFVFGPPLPYLPDVERGSAGAAALVDRDRGVTYGDDVLNTYFEQCYFQVDGVQTPGPGSSFVGRAFARGVVVNAGNAVPAPFASCFFTGYASSCLLIAAGSCVLTACTFQNIDPSGWDVFLEHGNLPIGLTALHCESQSWGFLGTTDDPESHSPYNVNLVGVRHENVPIGYLDDADFGPIATRAPDVMTRVARGDLAATVSIHWNFPGTLQLLGCRLGGNVELGAHSEGVVDIGTFFSPHAGKRLASAGGYWPGPRFEGNLATLRGVAGHIPLRGDGGDVLQQSPSLRMGDALYVTSSQLIPTNYTWQTGDAWLQGATPGSAPEREDLLATALHKAYQQRQMVAPASLPILGSDYEARHVAGAPILQEAWENVFGSENYSGPWFAFWQQHRNFEQGVAVGRLTLDGLVVPEVGAVYEVLWSIHPWVNYSANARSLRAVGRATITVSCVGDGVVPPAITAMTPGPTLALIALVEHGAGTDVGIGHFTPAVDLSLKVVPSAAFVLRTTVELGDTSTLLTVDKTLVPFEALSKYRLRLVFDRVFRPPWYDGKDYFKVSLRRLL